jgi:spartin
MSRLPQYQGSSIVQNAAAASRLIVTTSSHIGNMFASSAESFTQKTRPQKPVVFTQTTHNRVRKIGGFTTGAATLSNKTVGQVSKIAQNIGGTVSGRTKKVRSNPDDFGKPGILNKSMIAFNTIMDGVSYGGKHLLTTGGAAATTMMGHRYGDDARQVTAELTNSVTNVGLVYIDVTGVSRRAILKSVAKGMVVGRLPDGQEVVVGGGDGGEVPLEVHGAKPGSSASYAEISYPPGSSSRPGGSAPPPGYTPGDYKPSGGPEKYS